MQNPQPQDVYPEMPPQLQSFHLHAHDFRRQEMGTNYPVHPRSSQSADRSINASATQNPYGLPMVMDPRFLTNPAGNLSQPYPPYISSTPSGLLTGIPHHPTVGFTQGNQFINVVNIESPTRPKQTKKRKRRNSGTTQPRKRKLPSSASSEAGSHPAVDGPTQHLDSMPCGIGPPSSSEVVLPDSSEGLEHVDDAPSSLNVSALSVTPMDFHASHFSKSSEQPNRRAKDVWVWFWPVESKESRTPLEDNEPIIFLRPKSSAVACRLCWHQKKWQAYKNCDGVVTTLRTHMRNKHELEYEGYLRTDAWETALRQLKGGHTKEPFCLTGFFERLIRWMVIDDQSINVVDNPEFREMIAYLGDAAGLEDTDIPHRSKTLMLITDEYTSKYQSLKNDIMDALGRISLTSDMWSDLNRRSFMAVTAHWMAKGGANRLELRSALIAFREVNDSHTGDNLGHVLFDIIQDIGIAHKIGQITLDNASNNNTMMMKLETLLHSTDHTIQFHHVGNRIRCFAHVINISVQHILTELRDAYLFEDDHLSDTLDASSSSDAYGDALRGDLIGRVQKLVSDCRASGQRRSALRTVIMNGNEMKSWPQTMPDFDIPMLSDASKTGGTLPEVQLLRDCETRWSSTFLMISRVLTLYPALRRYITESDSDTLQAHLLSSDERKVLRDIYLILRVPHIAQEVLSSERTPTTSHAIPVYEALIEGWELLKESLPQLSRYIDVGINKLHEYLSLSRKTQIYAFSLVLHPEMKLQWIQNNWTPDESAQARDWIINAMLRYHQMMRRTSSSGQVQVVHRQPANIAMARSSAAQTRGLGQIFRVCKDPLAPSKSGTAHTEVLGDEDASQSNSGETDDSLDRKVVEQELRRYEEDGLLDDTPLVAFWEKNEHVYPLLFRLAMDVLPAQATAVPCERVFSSSKETCTLRRSQLGTTTIEMLQVLKYSYQRERLNFTTGLLAMPEDYTIEGPVTESAVLELLRAGKVEELKELYTNWNTQSD